MKVTFAPLQVSVKFETSPNYSGTPKQKRNAKEKTKGSLSTDVFEPPTSTGSRDFSSLMRISPLSFKKSSCKC